MFLHTANCINGIGTVSIQLPAKESNEKIIKIVLSGNGGLRKISATLRYLSAAALA